MTQNYSVVISSIRRECSLALCYRNKVIKSDIIDNVVANLILVLNKLLQSQNISLVDIDKIVFLSGPGSFTTSRILCAICAAIKQVYPCITIQPITLDEAINSLESYHNAVILLKCNTHVWHIYEGKWSIIRNIDLENRLANNSFSKQITSFDPIVTPFNGMVNQIDWPDLVECLINASKSIDSERKITPFYGI